MRLISGATAASVRGRNPDTYTVRPVIAATAGESRPALLPEQEEQARAELHPREPGLRDPLGRHDRGTRQRLLDHRVPQVGDRQDALDLEAGGPELLRDRRGVVIDERNATALP